MSLALHIALGALLYKLLGWWALPLGPAVHVLVDALCMWHPPGMHWPWGATQSRTRRCYNVAAMVVLDEWQYSWTLLADAFRPPDVTYKRVMFVVNIVACLALFWGGWAAAVVGLFHWLSADAFWAVRALWPALYARVERWNPHRLATWLVAHCWPGKPTSYVGAIGEMAAILLFTGGAVWL